MCGWCVWVFWLEFSLTTISLDDEDAGCPAAAKVEDDSITDASISDLGACGR